LEIGPSGKLTIGAAENISNGMIQLDGAGAVLTMFGTIAASATLTGQGTIKASGGRRHPRRGRCDGRQHHLLRDR
jgi:hypothetical protein